MSMKRAVLLKSMLNGFKILKQVTNKVLNYVQKNINLKNQAEEYKIYEDYSLGSFYKYIYVLISLKKDKQHGNKRQCIINSLYKISKFMLRNKIKQKQKTVNVALLQIIIK